MMGFRGTLEILKELGGRATVQQIKKRAKELDPLGTHSTSGHLMKLRAWRYVDYDRKSDSWFITEAKTQ